MEHYSLYDVSAGREVRQLPVKQEQLIMNVAVSPDDRTVAMDHGEGQVTLFEVATGKVCSRLGKKRDGNDMVSLSLGGYSPDGQMMACIAGRSVQLWDVASGKDLGKFQGHQNDIQFVRFSHDGKTLATGSLDGNMLIWDVMSLNKDSKPNSDQPAAGVEARWNGLADEDAGKAFEAINTLAATPKEDLVPLLKERLNPAWSGPRGRRASPPVRASRCRP